MNNGSIQHYQINICKNIKGRNIKYVDVIISEIIIEFIIIFF